MVSTGLVITATMSMANVVINDPRSLVLLPRFGIEFGFGDQTVEDICRSKGIDVNLFLLMVNTFLSPNYFPSKMLRYKESNLELLLVYLQKSHNYYLEVKIPKLHLHIEDFLSTAKHPAMLQLKAFFNEYIQEVREHISYEEQTAFPYIQLFISNNSDKALDSNYTITEFRKHHSDIEEKLSDLKNLLIKYLPPSSDSYLQVTILRELIDLENDLVNHARIEDKILIPIVEQLEQTLK
jgi:regulator of cell morphogenesis and NO signaling